jgi:hypothetical protein
MTGKRAEAQEKKSKRTELLKYLKPYAGMLERLECGYREQILWLSGTADKIPTNDQ